MVPRMNATMKVKKAMASTARAKGRERSNVRRFSHNGLKRFVGKGRVGLAAGIFWISRLAAAPIIASTTSRRPMTYSWFWNQYESMPPQTVPRITAKKESDSSNPFPLASRCGCKISGMAPYLAGTKNALWVPIRKTVDNTSTGPSQCCWTLPSQNPVKATSVMPISANFQKTRDWRLL